MSGVGFAVPVTPPEGVDVKAWHRFWSKVGFDAETGCAPWTATVGSSGYAQFYLTGRTRIGHRLAYEWLNGPIPEGEQTDHTCRMPRCVRHLEPVTNAENTRRGAASNPAKYAHQLAASRARHWKNREKNLAYMREYGARNRAARRERNRRYLAKKRLFPTASTTQVA